MGFQIHVELWKLNDSCLHDNFPTPFTDEVLESIDRQEAYSFTDSFSFYHQIYIAKEERQKNTFAIEWGCLIMTFGLKNALAIFSRIMVFAFKEFIHKFLEPVYFDD